MKAKKSLRQHLERIAFFEEGGNLMLTFPQQPGDFLEMRDLGGKLFARADGTGQYLRCPTCKHEYFLSHEEFGYWSFVALQQGRSFGWKCTNCNKAPIILEIKTSANQEAMIILHVK